jgi:hypothetical protein
VLAAGKSRRIDFSRLSLAHLRQAAWAFPATSGKEDSLVSPSKTSLDAKMALAIRLQ